MGKYATGKYALAISDRSGLQSEIVNAVDSAIEYLSTIEPVHRGERGG